MYEELDEELQKQFEEYLAEVGWLVGGLWVGGWVGGWMGGLLMLPKPCVRVGQRQGVRMCSCVWGCAAVPCSLPTLPLPLPRLAFFFLPAAWRDR